MITLEQELTGIEGVRAATVDVSGGEVTMLHVELSEDADRQRVAEAVDGVLRRHGLRSRPAGSGDAGEVDDEVATPEADVASEEAVDEVEVRVDAPDPADSVPTPEVGIDAVRVTHRRGVVEFVVTATDGTEATATSVPREEARHQALAEAVAGALGVAVRPHVVEVRRQPVGGREAVTVVLDLGQDLAVGTTFERGSVELALARAVAAALGEG